MEGRARSEGVRPAGVGVAALGDIRAKAETGGAGEMGSLESMKRSLESIEGSLRELGSMKGSLESMKRSLESIEGSLESMKRSLESIREDAVRLTVSHFINYLAQELESVINEFERVMKEVKNEYQDTLVKFCEKFCTEDQGGDAGRGGLLLLAERIAKARYCYEALKYHNPKAAEGCRGRPEALYYELVKRSSGVARQGAHPENR